MERLTFEGNFCDIARCLGEYRMTSECADGPCSQRKVWERLKAYEDTGITPEDITGRFSEETALKYAAAILHTTPERLRELAEADKAGRVLILDEQTTLAIAAGSYAIDISKRLRGATHMWDFRGIKGGPKTISYYDACLRLHDISEHVLRTWGDGNV